MGIGRCVPVDRFPKWTAERRAWEPAHSQHLHLGGSRDFHSKSRKRSFQMAQGLSLAERFMAHLRLGFRRVCSWEMSSAQVQGSMRGLSAQFGCFSVYPLAALRCQGCWYHRSSLLADTQLSESFLWTSYCRNYNLFQHQNHGLHLPRSPTTSHPS